MEVTGYFEISDCHRPIILRAGSGEIDLTPKPLEVRYAIFKARLERAMKGRNMIRPWHVQTDSGRYFEIRF